MFVDGILITTEKMLSEHFPALNEKRMELTIWGKYLATFPSE